jgi:hypothetical protein
VLAWTFVGSVGLDRIRGVTWHRHVHVLSLGPARLVPPEFMSVGVCAPSALRRTGQSV